MIRATVKCQQCGRVFAEDTAERFRDIAYAQQAMLLAVHSSPDIEPCEAHPKGGGDHLFVHAIEGDERRAERPFKIECLHVACVNKPAENRELSGEAPLEMIGALALVLHTSHEGHPIRIEWDGRVWSSPER